MRDKLWGVANVLMVGLLLALHAPDASAAGSCKKLPEVCQATCTKCKCDGVPNPVLCLTVCNVPKECREALSKTAK